jgi:hypothetical protein
VYKPLPYPVIDVSNDVTKSDGSNDGIWFHKGKLDHSNELIIGISPTNYHCFLICGKVEFHPRFIINKCKIKASKDDSVRARFFFRINNVSSAEIKQMETFLLSLENKRTATCHHGLLTVLSLGLGLRIPNHKIDETSPNELIRALFEVGLVDKDGMAKKHEVFFSRRPNFRRIQFDITILSWRLKLLFLVFNIWYKIVHRISPEKVVRDINN